MTTLQGQGASQGIALGNLRFFRRAKTAIVRTVVAFPQAELERFEAARSQAIEQLDALYQEALTKLGEENALLFQIHQMVLEDPDLIDAIHERIEGEHVCAEYAVDAAAKEAAAIFAAMEDPYMQARSADVLDVGHRLILILTHATDEPLSGEEPAIVAADDLAPSETARLDRSKVLAFVTAGGSLNSHTAIFARTMGIPAVVGLGDDLQDDLDGRPAAVDGEEGLLFIEPDEGQMQRLIEARADQAAERDRAECYRGKTSVTQDGHSVELCANVGGPQDVALALDGDAEGVGLFRSEFLYLQSHDYPDEETQLAAYRDVLERLKGKRVVIRTLDIGADKQADYFQLPHEENPAMGMRAIRICLTRPDVFRTQLRALYRASVYGKLAIMFPMITHVSEVRRIKAIVQQVQAELSAEGIPFDAGVELGIMIETPAAALLSESLAAEVDFFSVGTNDLTQYTLAMDRQNSSVAQFDDPAHEAVLKLIAMAADNAHKAGIWIGICGELGADATLTETFLRLGIDELSMSPTAILPTRARVCELSLSK